MPLPPDLRPFHYLLDRYGTQSVPVPLCSIPLPEVEQHGLFVTDCFTAGCNHYTRTLIARYSIELETLITFANFANFAPGYAINHCSALHLHVVLTNHIKQLD
jgi:hypothetical protein